MKSCSRTQRDPRAFLEDVRTRIGLVQSFVAGRTRVEFLRDQLLQSAVEREISVIGEAVVRFVAMRPELEARIRDCHKNIGLRNRLVHAYMLIDHDLLFDMVTASLDPLDEDARRLLEELGD